MAERCIKGDYIGFTFGDVHSSELGLMRVSNGSRYEQDLLPPLQDKKVQVAGRDGEIYFGSQYNTKPIKVPVAFDNMNEESFQKLKRLLADKKPKYLWFDETPYKQWLVKSANAQNFKWVCFDDSKNSGEKRVYKGEGTLEFSCFTPYAESRVTFLDDPIDEVWAWNREEAPKKLIKTEISSQLPFVWTKISSDDKNSKAIIERLETDTNWYHPSFLMDKEGFDWLSEEAINKVIDNNGILLINRINSQYDLGYTKKEEDFVSVSGERCVLMLTQQNGEYGWTGFLNWRTFYNIAQFWSLDSITELIDSIGVFDKNGAWERQVICIMQTEPNKYYGIIPVYNENGILVQVKPDYFKPVTLITYEQPGLSNNYNFNEWKISSGLRSKEEEITYHTILQKSEEQEETFVNIYNAGDVLSNLIININCSVVQHIKDKEYKTFVAFMDENKKEQERISLYKNSLKGLEKELVGEIIVKPFLLQGDDDGFIIDSKLKAILGVKKGKVSGNVYSKFHIGGDYFKIPPCSKDEYYTIESKAGNDFTVNYKHYYI